MKDHETNKSREFAFVTFESPADAKDAARDVNGKSLYQKAIKVEQTTKPSFESDRCEPPLPPKSRGRPRGLRGGGGGRGGIRGPLSWRGHMDNGGYSMNLNINYSRGPLPIKKGTTTTKWLEPLPSCRDVYFSPRDDGHSTKDSISSTDYPNYIYCDSGHSSSHDDYPSRGYSDRDGYGPDSNYSDHPSGGSYRDSYESYGNSCDAPLQEGPCHLMVNAVSDGRQERGLPPSMERKYSPPCDSYNTSSCRAPRGGGCGGS
ncbi:unnamed protein product [Nyctereutes procyonoides]|uniref:(raccoon dog) hypothetical protein n=1 Tax=Nyctereutes procyonoides TaxID=34880 RepID=A0A811Z369_NYCPR|nr:unnamed protein product [Nyctereutes procyonoides]